jgi:hypothetical protein
MGGEYSVNGKYLELLKDIAPGIMRVADQATIFSMGKYNPGYVLPSVAVDDENVGTVLNPARNLVNAVDIQVCVNKDSSLKRQRSVPPKHNLALGLVWGSHC